MNCIDLIDWRHARADQVESGHLDAPDWLPAGGVTVVLPGIISPVHIPRVRRYSIFTQNDQPLGDCDTLQQVIDTAVDYLGDNTSRRVYAIDSAPDIHLPVVVVKRCSWNSYIGSRVWEADHERHQSHAPGFDTCAEICASEVQS